MSAQENKGPLSGLRVLDASIMAAGPWTAALLGMLGAEVIKVEPPAGDGTRWAMPSQRGMGTNFIAMNVNKKDIILDLKSAEGREAALSLARTSDIFVQNFRVGVMERLGLDYATLATVNPRLVYCSISGFGSKGPLSKAGCGDPIMQAFSGFASLNGAEGDLAESFRFTGFLDLATASVSVQSILAALLHRNETGKGQHVEVSMLEAALEMQYTRVSELLGAGLQPMPRGSENPGFAPDRAYAALDREVFISIFRQEQWRSFCGVLGVDALIDDARFATNRARCENRTALDEIIAPILRAKPSVWWLRALGRVNVPCTIGQTYESFRHHRQIFENGMIADVTTPQWGTVTVGGLPWSFSATPCEVRAPSIPGADTEAILSGLDPVEDVSERRLGAGR